MALQDSYPADAGYRDTAPSEAEPRPTQVAPRGGASLVTAAARTIALTLAYEGTGYAGWQRQPGERTVQAILEDVLAVIDEQPVTAIAAGRTDAGVHALGQVVSAEVRN